jgi:hypothetical protein
VSKIGGFKDAVNLDRTIHFLCLISLSHPSVHRHRAPVMAKREELSPEAASQLTKEEYNGLKSYATLYKFCKLAEDNHIAVETLEGSKYVLQVTSYGWKVVDGGTEDERKRDWEMVEDLLRSVSERFSKGWDKMFLDKLQAVADEQALAGEHGNSQGSFGV